MPMFDESQVAAKASTRFQRCPARKARQVADLIRGRSVGEAFRILQMTHRPSAGTIIMNLLKSAVANANHAEYADTDGLVVGEIMVDGGPIMYRMQPMSRGRAGRIRKRFCHVSMKLIEVV